MNLNGLYLSQLMNYNAMMLGCVSLFSAWVDPPLLGDSFYWYCCKRCKATMSDKQPVEPSGLEPSTGLVSHTLDTQDELKRLNLNWYMSCLLSLNPLFLTP
jgi:hypothetical protein